MSKNIRIFVNEISVPDTMIQMLNGTGSFAIYNQFFKFALDKPISNVLKDQVSTNSKVVLSISQPPLLYHGAEGKFTQNFTFVLDGDFRFFSPYSELISYKKQISYSTNEEQMMNLVKLENLIMYTTEWLLLATFSELPVEKVVDAKSDRDLVKILFDHIFDSKSSKPFEYLSDRYFNCISNPPVWVKIDKKSKIRPSDDETTGLEVSKFCTLFEVLYKTLSTNELKKFSKHPRFIKQWLQQKHILVPMTRIIQYEKKSKDGGEAEQVERINATLKITVLFPENEENIKKKLYHPKIPTSTYTKYREDNSLNVFSFDKYIELYNGSKDFEEGAELKRSSQAWSGKIVFKLRTNMVLFGIGYPKIEEEMNAFLCTKRLYDDDKYEDLLNDGSEDNFEDIQGEDL